MDRLPDNLVERLKRGEHEAFNELVRACHASVFRLANRLLRNVDDAQEVAQECFLAAYQGIGKFQERANVRTWLLSIAYRKAVDRLKRRTTNEWQLFGQLDDADFWDKRRSVQDFTDWKSNPEQTFDNNRMSERLKAALEKVPAESKAVFELRDLQGLSSREAAEALGISEGALRVRLHRVRQFLMTELNEIFGRDE